MPGGPARFGSRRTRFTRGSWTMGMPKTKSCVKSSEKSLTNLKQPNVELNPLNGNEALTLAKKMLHGSCVPKLLPCRESQFNDIYNFLVDKLTQQIGGYFNFVFQFTHFHLILVVCTYLESLELERQQQFMM